MQIAVLGQPFVVPVLEARGQWIMRGERTRGRGRLPLVEVPACRRLVAQAVTVPLFKNEFPTRDQETADGCGGARQVRQMVHRQRGDDGVEPSRLGEILERD